MIGYTTHQCCIWCLQSNKRFTATFNLRHSNPQQEWLSPCLYSEFRTLKSLNLVGLNLSRYNELTLAQWKRRARFNPYFPTFHLDWVKEDHEPLMT
jgi:hypothetical protein